jgi:S1-C subfamily serine protease
MRVQVFKPFIYILVMVALVACGGGSPTQAPVATEAPAQPTTPPTSIPEPTAAPTDAPTEAPTETPASGAINNLQDVQKAIIQIEAQGTFIDPEFGLVMNGAGRGSGFIIDPSGIAVTNNHVVTGAALLKVWVGGETESRNARVLGVSECSDLAVIDISGDGYEYLDLYDGQINVGMDIYVAGYPLGDPEFTLTKGVISKARANGESSWASVDSVIEYDASTNPGNSGGPVITSEGQVIGVHYAGNASTRQAFGISRDAARPVIDELKTGNNLDTIGVNGSAVGTDDGSLTGVWVSSVQSGSPADKAGVVAGDIITMMENLVLATDGTMADYCDILRSHDPTDTLSIQVLRWANGEVLEGQLNGRELELAATFDPGTGNDNSGGAVGNENLYIDPSAAASGDVYYFTEFEDELADWEWFLMSGQEENFDLLADNSRLRFDIQGRDTWVYVANNALDLADVRIDTSTENLGMSTNNISLFCRYSDRGWYEFNVASNGEYWIYRYDANTQAWRTLWTGGSTLIKMGQEINHYGAICEGSELSLIINDTLVKTIKDTTLKSGLTGISVSSFNVTPIVVEFDAFALSVP